MIYESKLTASEVSKVLDVLVECNINQLWHERVLNGVVADINSGFYTVEEAVYKFIDECIPNTYKTGYKPKSEAVAEAVEVTEDIKDTRDTKDPIDNIDTEKEKEIVKAKAKAEADEKKTKVDQWITENSPTAKGSGDPEKVWNVPITSHFDHLKNKEVPFITLATLTTISKDGKKANNPEAERYIYKNDPNFKEVYEMAKISESTFKRHFNKLKKVKIGDNKPLITTENSPNGIVYKINYGTSGTDPNGEATKQRYYTTIESDILKYLIDTSNDSMIKLYIFLKVHLVDVNGNYLSKEMQREYLADGIGFKRTNRMCDVISNLTTDLVAKGLLFKTEKMEVVYDENLGKEMPKTKVTYKLATHDQWLAYKESLKNRKA